MQINHLARGQRGRFVAFEQERNAGFIQYAEGKDKIIIESTVVAEEFRGQGVGRELVAAVVEYARARGDHLSTTCWYAQLILENEPLWVQMLHSEEG